MLTLLLQNCSAAGLSSICPTLTSGSRHSSSRLGQSLQRPRAVLFRQVGKELSHEANRSLCFAVLPTIRLASLWSRPVRGTEDKGELAEALQCDEFPGSKGLMLFAD